MTKFRKLLPEVEARRITYDQLDDIATWCYGGVSPTGVVFTDAQTAMTFAPIGSYIVRHGTDPVRFEMVNAHVFAQEYEIVDNDVPAQSGESQADKDAKP